MIFFSYISLFILMTSVPHKFVSDFNRVYYMFQCGKCVQDFYEINN